MWWGWCVAIPNYSEMVDTKRRGGMHEGQLRPCIRSCSSDSIAICTVAIARLARVQSYCINVGSYEPQANNLFGCQSATCLHAIGWWPPKMTWKRKLGPIGLEWTVLLSSSRARRDRSSGVRISSTFGCRSSIAGHIAEFSRDCPDLDKWRSSRQIGARSIIVRASSANITCSSNLTSVSVTRDFEGRSSCALFFRSFFPWGSASKFHVTICPRQFFPAAAE